MLLSPCFQALWNPLVSKRGCSLEAPGEFVKVQILTRLV